MDALVKEEGLDNDLCDMLLADPAFMITKEDLDKILKPENFTGRSEQQTEEFVAECIQPILDTCDQPWRKGKISLC